MTGQQGPETMLTTLCSLGTSPSPGAWRLAIAAVTAEVFGVDALELRVVDSHDSTDPREVAGALVWIVGQLATTSTRPDEALSWFRALGAWAAAG